MKNTYEYRILVTGSRDWPDRTIIEKALESTVDKIIKGLSWFEGDVSIVVVHGNAWGADLQADVAARRLAALGLPVTVERHPADWNKHGKRAGFLRNKEMVDAGAQVCLAFIVDESKGATMCANLAEEAGIPVFYFRLDTRVPEGVESTSTEETA